MSGWILLKGLNILSHGNHFAKANRFSECYNMFAHACG